MTLWGPLLPPLPPFRPRTLSTLACRLRPKLKLIAHGCRRSTSSAAVLLMRSRLTVASSSDCPPDKKKTPGTAGGTRLRKVRSVSSAVSAGLACKRFTTKNQKKNSLGGGRGVSRELESARRVGGWGCAAALTFWRETNDPCGLEIATKTKQKSKCCRPSKSA